VNDVPLQPDVSEGSLRGAGLDEAVAVAVRAFDDDPFFEYLFPDRAQRHRSVALLHRTVLDRVGDLAVTRTALVDGRVAGVAMWVPPGAWPYPAALQVRQLFSAVRAFVPHMGSFARAGRILRSVELTHPKRPQWYLQLLMVDPPHQRKGIGALLQAPTLATCDAEGLPAWLETQKEENLAYYARFGFQVAKEHRPIASGPAMWSLSRDPAG
jgi:GNAT superfamily N-acetyltransferase